jgi:hypothetical protein
MDNAKSNGAKPFPHLVAAFFCEKTLTEPDGVVSAIRIVDIVQLPPLPKDASKMARQGVMLGNLVFVMMIRAGGYRGKITWDVYAVSPSGKKVKIAQQKDVDIGDSPEKGINVAFPPGFKWEKPGVYWFEIYVNNKRMTRTPLVIKLQPVVKPDVEEKKPKS